ncbi:tripartite tricarboxylate transporter substrate binding protein [Bordetella sp. H567]|uniref:tripartite tricarboxylate transporter substrate binding protein n=1 Tax=Bordetella sp. H567 TaxID=1697043 RepID=UPI00082A87EA|nr:tripartite tricarboxylate transporter substrate binding protein [Bordetella sp. H567]
MRASVAKRPGSACARTRQALHAAAALCLAWLCLATPGVQAADGYPDHPITLVLAYPPGGGTDLVARLLARELDKVLGVNVVVENRPGGASVIGTSVVTRAAPDGYTLLLADPAFATNPSLMRHLPYDPQSLTPVATVTVSPLVLSVPAASPIKSLGDLVAAGRQSREGVTFASAGLGSSPHLAGELLKLRTGANLVHVPYKGSGPAMTDLIGGRIDFAFATLPAASQYILKGQLRGLATTGDTRSKLLPELPTVGETIPDFRVQFWTALLAPRGTPAAVLEKLNAAVKTALQSPAMLSGLEQAGEHPTYMTQAQTAAFIAAENSKWSKVMAEGNIHIQ